MVRISFRTDYFNILAYGIDYGSQNRNSWIKSQRARQQPLNFFWCIVGQYWIAGCDYHLGLTEFTISCIYHKMDGDNWMRNAQKCFKNINPFKKMNWYEWHVWICLCELNHIEMLSKDLGLILRNVMQLHRVQVDVPLS